MNWKQRLSEDKLRWKQRLSDGKLRWKQRLSEKQRLSDSAKSSDSATRELGFFFFRRFTLQVTRVRRFRKHCSSVRFPLFFRRFTLFHLHTAFAVRPGMLSMFLLTFSVDSSLLECYVFEHAAQVDDQRGPRQIKMGNGVTQNSL